MEFKPCNQLIENIAKVIIGKKESIELLLVALLGNGHVLIEDVPGVGKTLLAKSLSKSIGGIFKRVQFTPDLLPADITGFNVYNRQSGTFEFQPGPVMTNVLLADEINRTVPRTQASLLESMEEHQVTVDGKSEALPEPFFVMATQNPIELEGTFTLPEAQLDRFLLKIHLGYPSETEEVEIMQRFQEEDPYLSLEPVLNPEQIVAMQEARKKIKVAPPIKTYIASIAEKTRRHPALQYGVSPRGTLALMRASQALAALRGRDYVLPDDVKNLAQPVLAHRLVLTDQEKLRGAKPSDFLHEMIKSIQVPVYGN